MSRLVKNPAGADWTTEPAVPDPADPVKAWANPGAVKPAYQLLSDRIWSIASGAHSLKQAWIDGVGQQVVNMPNGVLAVVSGGGLQVRNGLAFVDIDDDGVRATRQGRECLLAAGGMFWVNPPSLPTTTDARLALYPENRPVAVALVQLSGNQVTVRPGSIGIKGVALDPIPNPVRLIVELAGQMADAAYGVQATIQDDWGDNPIPIVLGETFPLQVIGRTAAGFSLRPPNGAKALSAFTTAEFMITVYGRSA